MRIIRSTHKYFITDLQLIKQNILVLEYFKLTYRFFWRLATFQIYGFEVVGKGKIDCWICCLNESEID